MQPLVAESTSSPKPAPRRSAAGGVFGDSLYVFGGVDGTAHHFSDVWRLSLNDYSWEVLSSDELPPIRLPGVSHVGDTFYLFGGRGGDETFFNDMWEVDENGVSPLIFDGPSPAPRYGHSQIAVDGNLYVFGGVRKHGGEHELFNDLWRFDIKKRQWTLLSQEGPNGRYGAAMVGWSDELVLYGGRVLAEEWWYSDETWVFELDKQQWRRIEPPESPSARYTSGVTSTDSSMYLYGGMDSSYEPVDTQIIRRLNRVLCSLPVRNSVFPTFKPNRFYSDLWRFDRIDQTWEQVTTQTGIPPLKTPLMGIYNGSIIIGFGNNLENHYNDVWKIDRTPQT